MTIFSQVVSEQLLLKLADAIRASLQADESKITEARANIASRIPFPRIKRNLELAFSKRKELKELMGSIIKIYNKSLPDENTIEHLRSMLSSYSLKIEELSRQFEESQGSSDALLNNLTHFANTLYMQTCEVDNFNLKNQAFDNSKPLNSFQYYCIKSFAPYILERYCNYFQNSKDLVDNKAKLIKEYLQKAKDELPVIDNNTVATNHAKMMANELKTKNKAIKKHILDFMFTDHIDEHMTHYVDKLDYLVQNHCDTPVPETLVDIPSIKNVNAFFHLAPTKPAIVEDYELNDEPEETEPAKTSESSDAVQPLHQESVILEGELSHSAGDKGASNDDKHETDIPISALVKQGVFQAESSKSVDNGSNVQSKKLKNKPR